MLKLTSMSLYRANQLAETIRQLETALDHQFTDIDRHTVNINMQEITIPRDLMIEQVKAKIADSHAELAALGIELAPNPPRDMGVSILQTQSFSIAALKRRA